MMPGGKSKRKTKCPGCHTAHSQHYAGPPEPHCTGEQEKNSDSDSEDIQRAMVDPPPKSSSTTSKGEDISTLLSAVRSLWEQVHDLALDNKAIKDQFATQQNADVKPHDNSTTSPASKDPSVPVTDNHAAAAPDRSRTKLIEAITRGEFVHFTDLLRLEGDLHASEGQQVIVTPQGQLLTKRTRPQCDISSFDSWLAAWFQFENYDGRTS